VAAQRRGACPRTPRLRLKLHERAPKESVPLGSHTDRGEERGSR